MKRSQKRWMAVMLRWPASSDGLLVQRVVFQGKYRGKLFQCSMRSHGGRIEAAMVQLTGKGIVRLSTILDIHRKL